MSLIGTYDNQNIFAKIIRGEMPAVKVYENAQTLAFMDVFPSSEGHTLVIPKMLQARNILDIPPQDIGQYMQTVQSVSHAVSAALKPDGIRLMQFNGALAGQTVFHLHFHIIPVYQGQNVRLHGSGAMASPETLQPIATRIMRAMVDS